MNLPQFLIIIGLFISQSAFCQFEKLPDFNPGFQDKVMDIECLNGDCVIIGSKGIGFTSDAGNSVVYVNSPVTNTLQKQGKIQMFSSSEYFMSMKITESPEDEFWLLHTLDSANSWDTVFHSGNYLQFNSINPQSFSMLTSDVGLLSTSEGILLKSETQFQQMDTVQLSPSSALIPTCEYISSSTLLCLQHSDLFMSLDSGNIWNEVVIENAEPLASLSAYNEDIFVVGSNAINEENFLYRTDNSGLDWDTAISIIHKFSLATDYQFTSPNEVFAVGLEYFLHLPILLRSNSEQTLLELIPIPYNFTPTELEFVNDSIALIGGSNGELIRYNSNEPINDPDTIDSTTAIAFSEQEGMPSLFPNPASNRVRLLFPGNKQEPINVYDLHGNLAFQQSLFSGDFMDISNLGKGVYIVAILNQRIKLIKQ